MLSKVNKNRNLFSISSKTEKNEIAVFYLMRSDNFLVVDVEGFCQFFEILIGDGLADMIEGEEVDGSCFLDSLD